ncbi:L7Ae/L30e/S12e/Gadd45 family ribosomal protein [Salibacterium aidingense]|uniref:L7Ae/L30e/S12e/Gadd45 family ribosomal protein n=1 Tax=Salibacterium aidingense TaxID=384933 RepID=UPI0003F7BF0B|nr:ribosomal L7Ae/L30e/S12e/Gadd45 family protein [Salibacterium aidingense]
MNPSIYSFLGLAAKAGKVKTGDHTVLEEIRKQSLSLVLIAGDASPNTKKKFKDKSSYYQVPCYVTGDRDGLGRAVGKGSRVIIGITDKGFGGRLISMLDE